MLPRQQGAEDAGAAADLAQLGARGREQVSDLTLLGQAASISTPPTRPSSPRGRKNASRIARGGRPG